MIHIRIIGSAVWPFVLAGFLSLLRVVLRGFGLHYVEDRICFVGITHKNIGRDDALVGSPLHAAVHKAPRNPTPDTPPIRRHRHGPGLSSRRRPKRAGAAAAAEVGGTSSEREEGTSRERALRRRRRPDAHCNGGGGGHRGVGCGLRPAHWGPEFVVVVALGTTADAAAGPERAFALAFACLAAATVGRAHERDGYVDRWINGVTNWSIQSIDCSPRLTFATRRPRPGGAQEETGGRRVGGARGRGGGAGGAGAEPAAGGGGGEDDGVGRERGAAERVHGHQARAARGGLPAHAAEDALPHVCRPGQGRCVFVRVLRGGIQAARQPTDPLNASYIYTEHQGT
jgi:hypothetical protein